MRFPSLPMRGFVVGLKVAIKTVQAHRLRSRQRVPAALRIWTFLPKCPRAPDGIGKLSRTILIDMRKTAGKLDDFRAEKDDFFANDSRSPLNSHQRRLLKRLAYFDENPRLVIKAKIDRGVEPRDVHMETTCGVLLIHSYSVSQIWLFA